MLTAVPLTAGLVTHLVLAAGAAGVGAAVVPGLIANVTHALAPPGTPAGTAVGTLTWAEVTSLDATSRAAFFQGGGHVVG
jgi:hypothetical protein